jgi:hypothetical protein
MVCLLLKTLPQFRSNSSLELARDDFLRLLPMSAEYKREKIVEQDSTKNQEAAELEWDD